MATTPTKALAQQLRADLGVTNPRRKITGGAYAALGRFVGYGDMGWPYSVTTAMHGISHARTTGRLSGRVEMELRELSDWQWCNLAADVAENCSVIGEVPAYLLKRFA